MKGRAAVFLDRDGVLLPDHDYLSDPRKAVPYAGTAAALKLLRKAGYKLVVVSNQSGIGRGYFGIPELAAVQRALEKRLAAKGASWDLALFCPHAPGKGCTCRKPKPGLLYKAKRRLGIDFRSSWFVGDKDSDIACGRKAGCRTVLVRTGQGKRVSARQARPDAVKRDVLSAAKWIAAQA